MSITATVPSRTTANVTYAVRLNDDGSTACNCPAGVHGRHCWHVAAVREQTAYEAVEAEWASIYRAQLKEALEAACADHNLWVRYHRNVAIKFEIIAELGQTIEGIKTELARW